MGTRKALKDWVFTSGNPQATSGYSFKSSADLTGDLNFKLIEAKVHDQKAESCYNKDRGFQLMQY